MILWLDRLQVEADCPFDLKLDDIVLNIDLSVDSWAARYLDEKGIVSL